MAVLETTEHKSDDGGVFHWWGVWRIYSKCWLDTCGKLYIWCVCSYLQTAGFVDKVNTCIQFLWIQKLKFLVLSRSGVLTISKCYSAVMWNPVLVNKLCGKYKTDQCQMLYIELWNYITNTIGALFAFMKICNTLYMQYRQASKWKKKCQYSRPSFPLPSAFSYPLFFLSPFSNSFFSLPVPWGLVWFYHWFVMYAWVKN